MKTKISADFQICTSVPLMIINEIFLKGNIQMLTFLRVEVSTRAQDKVSTLGNLPVFSYS